MTFYERGPRRNIFGRQVGFKRGESVALQASYTFEQPHKKYGGSETEIHQLTATLVADTGFRIQGGANAADCGDCMRLRGFKNKADVNNIAGLNRLVEWV